MRRATLPANVAEIRQAAAAQWTGMSIAEAAVVLQRSIRQLRRWEKEGKMPPRRKWSRQKIYEAADIAALRRQLGQ